MAEPTDRAERLATLARLAGCVAHIPRVLRTKRGQRLAGTDITHAHVRAVIIARLDKQFRRVAAEFGIDY